MPIQGHNRGVEVLSLDHPDYHYRLRQDRLRIVDYCVLQNL